MKLEHKALNCEFKAAGDDGSFELYALVFGNIDRQGDLILPGAVSNLDELISGGWGALNHANAALPIAYADSAAQDARGLLIRGQFHTHQAAQDCRTVVRERMAAGKTVPCSIGYVVDDASYETRGGEEVRVLRSIRVYEFSFVNLPANPAAGVVSAKALRAEPMDDAEKGLVAALRRAVGLSAKKGRPISAANHAALSDHASAISETADRMKQAHKSMQSCLKDMGDRLDDFKAFLDSHDPDADNDDDSSDPGDTDNDRGGKKAETPPAVVPIDQLRRRALEGRRMTRCP